MHFHFDFSTIEILWTLTFAGQLVLLVVLMGRDRVQRFPWFTTSIVLVGLRLLTQKMLSGRLAPLPFSAVLISLVDLGAICGLLVLLELARHAFGGVKRRTWIVGALAMLVVGGVVVGFWGAWPDWKTLNSDPNLAVLRVMQLFGQKGSLLVDVLAIEVGLVIVLLGRGLSGGWRSHTQRLAIGLSTAAISQLAVQGILQAVFAKAVPKTQVEYDRIIGLRDKIFNANNVVYLVVMAWWVACLWMDEPGTAVLEPADDVEVEIPAQAETVETPGEVDPTPETEKQDSER